MRIFKRHPPKDDGDLADDLVTERYERTGVSESMQRRLEVALHGGPFRSMGDGRLVTRRRDLP